MSSGKVGHGRTAWTVDEPPIGERLWRNGPKWGCAVVEFAKLQARRLLHSENMANYVGFGFLLSSACAGAVVWLGCSGSSDAPPYEPPSSTTATATVDPPKKDAGVADAKPARDAEPNKDSGMSIGLPVYGVSSDTKEAMPQATDTFHGEEVLSCQPGEAVTGISIRNGGLALDGIGIRCNKFLEDGALGVGIKSRLAGNESQEIQGDTICGIGEYVTEFIGRPADRFGVLRVGCRNAKDIAQGKMTSLRRTDYIGTSQDEPPRPFRPPVIQPELISACAEGSAMVGMRVGVGRACNAFNCFRVVGKVTPICAELTQR
jgi:hypothetical protein